VRQTITSTQDRLAREGVRCTTLIDEGEPGDVLVRLAEQCGADILVVGNKGMQRRVLGSVPNTVAHKAPCSVLVVKTT
jgi:nucleotide-binding universal stress UspA family protein